MTISTSRVLKEAADIIVREKLGYRRARFENLLLDIDVECVHLPQQK